MKIKKLKFIHLYIKFDWNTAALIHSFVHLFIHVLFLAMLLEQGRVGSLKETC